MLVNPADLPKINNASGKLLNGEFREANLSLSHDLFFTLTKLCNSTIREITEILDDRAS